MVAVVALAPELAFRTRLPQIGVEEIIESCEYTCVISPARYYILHSETGLSYAFYENFSLPESDLKTMHTN